MALPVAPEPASVPTPLPRRRRRPKGGLVLAAVFGLLALLANLVLVGGTKGQPVLAARHTIVAGTEVGPDDFAAVDLDAPAATLAQLVAGSQVSAVKGQIATHNLVAGDLVARSALAPTAAAGAQRAMSIPVDQGRAVGGTLSVGDIVDVIDSSTGVPTYVATGSQVLAAGGAKSSVVAAAASHYTVTIAVDERQALAVAQAITAGKLDIVRSTGAPAATPPPPPTVPASVPTTRVGR